MLYKKHTWMLLSVQLCHLSSSQVQQVDVALRCGAEIDSRWWMPATCTSLVSTRSPVHISMSSSPPPSSSVLSGCSIVIRSRTWCVMCLKSILTQQFLLIIIIKQLAWWWILPFLPECPMLVNSVLDDMWSPDLSQWTYQKVTQVAFSALTQLDWHDEEHMACKSCVMRYWHHGMVKCLGWVQVICMVQPIPLSPNHLMLH